jgi:hypothetical protein
MFLVTISSLRPSSSLGLNSTTSVSAYRMGVCPGPTYDFHRLGDAPSFASIRGIIQDRGDGAGEPAQGLGPGEIEDVADGSVVRNRHSGAGADNGLAIRPLVAAEERQDDEWRAMRERAERAAEATVAYDHVRASRHVVMRGPRLEVDVGRNRPELLDPASGVADRKQQPNRQRGEPSIAKRYSAG